MVNGKKYVGSSIRIRYRLGQHKSNLKAGRHVNKHLQNSWNKHGEDKFTFRVIEETDDITIREQHWLDVIQPEYNILTVAYSPSGYTHTEESLNKISRASKELWNNRREEMIEIMTEVNRDPERNDRRSKTLTEQRSGKYQGMILIKDNEELIIDGSLKRFALKHNLHYSTMWRVLNDKADNVLGWKLKK